MAEDLAAFLPALLGGELLSDTQLAAMLIYDEDNKGEGYGLGIGSRSSHYGLLVGHEGVTSGFQADMVYLADEDLTIIVLTNNFDSDIVPEVVNDALQLVLGD